MIMFIIIIMCDSVFPYSMLSPHHSGVHRDVCYVCLSRILSTQTHLLYTLTHQRIFDHSHFRYYGKKWREIISKAKFTQ